jgi:N-carbamoyl-L-amino-acid hydrolase
MMGTNNNVRHAPEDAHSASQESDWSQEHASASALFDGFAADGEGMVGAIGITRDTYGDGEQRAHDRVRALALTLGLEIRTDGALNLYLTFPGADRALPAAMTGSHLDSVPCGGNFDGAAGVVAGLTVFARWRRLGFMPPHDCTLMAIRAEESAWFPISYIGSKAAFGLLDADSLAVRRDDTGLALSSHIARLGGSPDDIAQGRAFLSPLRISRFVELHIEQGPVLTHYRIPVGIVTGIRGAFRFRHAHAQGQYAHSGAAPRATRKDAVLTTAKFIAGLEDDWDVLENAGHDIVVTCGKFATDPVRADFSKVSGDVRFSLDVRSFETPTLDDMEARVLKRASDLSAERGVQFILGEVTRSAPAVMDARLQTALHTAAKSLGIDVMALPSGAGHDTATFAHQGVPSAMIFVRNEHGSHNPDEAMSLDDFIAGTQLLEAVLKQPSF